MCCVKVSSVAPKISSLSSVRDCFYTSATQVVLFSIL